MYDLEIWRAGGSRNFAERMRSGILKAVIGGGYKAAGEGRRGCLFAIGDYSLDGSWVLLSCRRAVKSGGSSVWTRMICP